MQNAISSTSRAALHAKSVVLSVQLVKSALHLVVLGIGPARLVTTTTSPTEKNAVVVEMRSLKIKL